MNTWPEHMNVGPLREWPGVATPVSQRIPSPFRASLQSTLKTLDHEIRHLADTSVEVRSAALLVAIPAGAFRKDGRPRADARAEHSGVVFSMDTRHGHLSYPADRFTEWEDNLRAIALTLESLRKADRYGVTAHGEQYRGFLAIEGTVPTSAGDAIATLTSLVGVTADEPPADLLRRAKRATHPDTASGPDMAARWHDVVEAERVLKAAGAI